MDVFQAIILGLVQGLTEFLPVSSSAHLGLISSIFNWNEQLQIDIILHVASLGALIIYFRKDIIAIFKGLLRQGKKEAIIEANKNATNILVSLLPLIPIYLLLKDWIDSIQSFSPTTLIIFMIFGALLIFADYRGRGNTVVMKGLTKRQALLIGIGQGIALFSGVSRSGITITIGLLLGLKEEAAKRYTFLLSIPTILGGFLLEIVDVIKGDISLTLDMALILGIIASFISAYIALLLLFRLGNKIKLTYYGLYRIIIGLILLLILF